MIYLRKGRPNELWIGSWRQKELPVVLPADGSTFALLLVSGVHEQLVVHRLHRDLLRRILADVEAQLQLFRIAPAAAAVAGLDQWRVQPRQPVGMVTEGAAGQ